MQKPKYRAFISYSHSDADWGSWLHKKLENFRFPAGLVGKQTDKGMVPTRLRPIFRDRSDLVAAGDLSHEVEQALSKSENLIVICSPRSAQSKWVDQEIRFFRQKHPNGTILAAIVEGEPFASRSAGRGKTEATAQEQEYFPPALLFQIDETGARMDRPAEPLAADLRGHADGKRLGLLKLLAGPTGLVLDDLVQRDLRRARRRVIWITLAASTAMLTMGQPDLDGDISA